MLRVAVLVSGGGTNLQAIIDAVESGRIHDTLLAAVISNKADAYALERARKHGIEAKAVDRKDYADKTAQLAALEQAIDEAQPELIVLAGFLMVLPKQLVSKYDGRIINIHPSLIPSFCGAGFYGLKVHEAALKRGVKVSGATVHFVDEGTDTGPIIAQKAVEVLDGDTPESLQQRIMEQAEWVILPEVIDAIATGKLKIGGFDR